MKMFNVLTGIKSLSLVLTAATLSHVALAGTATGNSTNKVVAYVGAKKIKEHPSVVADVQLNDNEVGVKQKMLISRELEGLAMSAIESKELLQFYSFPNNKQELEELYRKSISLEGDFSTLQNHNNPFSLYIKKDHKGWDGNEGVDIKGLIQGGAHQVYPLKSETFDLMTKGLMMQATLQVNPKIQSGTCGVCTTKSYKPIPKDGINLEVACFVDTIDDGNGNSLYYRSVYANKRYRSAYAKKEIEYSTNVQATIYTQQQSLSISTPILTEEATQTIINKYCQSSDMKFIKIKISCQLQGVKQADTDKLRQSFGTESLQLGSHAFQLVNNSAHVMERADAFILKGQLESDKTDYVQSVGLGVKYSPFYVTVKDGYDVIQSYKFPEAPSRWGYEKKYIYAESESDFADMVRRSFISAYEALNRKNEAQ